jgi:hypothetical protein
MPQDPVLPARAAILPEERAQHRVEGRLEASLKVEGAAWRCWICDISAGGAGLEPALPAVLGKSGRISSLAFDFDRPLPCRVVNVAEGRTCLAFELDAATSADLQAFLDTNTA